MCDIITSPKRKTKPFTKAENRLSEKEKKMTGELRQVIENVKMTEEVSSENLVSENCNCSGYTMASVAGCLLLCVGIVIYALFCA